MRVFAFRRTIKVEELKRSQKVSFSPKVELEGFDLDKPLTIILLQDDNEAIIEDLKKQVLRFANE